MDMTDTFTVPVSADRLWEALIDVERIAPCVPGFELHEMSDPDFRGAIKVKVGAITVQYDAVITFVERDEAAHRAVLSVSGKERRGAGSVNATTTISLIDKGNETTAEILTDVNITGKVAQFGRGIIQDVNKRLLEQFVAGLNERVLAPPEKVATNGGDPAGQTPTPLPPATPAAPLDLGSVARGAVLKRAAPALVGVALLALIVAIIKRRS
jgi:carbon monoxide dehydrogenase subunit G